MRREVKSFWYPTWLAQPAALVEGSKLIDAPPHRLGFADVAAGGQGPRSRRAAHLDAVVCLRRQDGPRAQGGQSQSQDRHDRRQGRGRCGGHRWTACHELDFVGEQRVRLHHQGGRRRPRLRRHQGTVVSRSRRPHRSQRGTRRSCTTWTNLPFVTPVYKRDLTIENYFSGYLLHPYISFYTGRGCKSRCTFCLWPQTVGGHDYRVRSVGHVIDELKWAMKAFPQVKEVLLRRRHADRQPAARRGAGEGDRQARHHLVLQRQGQRAAQDARGAGATTAAAVRWSATSPATSRSCTTSRRACWSTSPRRFTKDCHELGIVIHGTFILGLPGETKETIEETIRFATEINPHTIQVSLAAPYPGTFLHKQAKENGWFATDNADWSTTDGSQIAPLQLSASEPHRNFRTRSRTSTSGSISARRRSPRSSARCCARRR